LPTAAFRPDTRFDRIILPASEFFILTMLLTGTYLGKQ